MTTAATKHATSPFDRRDQHQAHVRTSSPVPPNNPPPLTQNIDVAAPPLEQRGQQNRLSKFVYHDGKDGEKDTLDSEKVLVTSGEKDGNIHSGGWVGFKPSSYRNVVSDTNSRRQGRRPLFSLARAFRVGLFRLNWTKNEI